MSSIRDTSSRTYRITQLFAGLCDVLIVALELLREVRRQRSERLTKKQLSSPPSKAARGILKRFSGTPFPSLSEYFKQPILNVVIDLAASAYQPIAPQCRRLMGIVL